MTDPGRGLSNSGKRERHAHLKPRLCIAHAQVAAMRLGHQPAQVQAQTNAAALPATGRVGTIKGLRQQPKLLVGYAWPVVAHYQMHRPISMP